LRRLRHERRQITIVDQFADIHFIGDVIEQLVIAFGEAPTVEPVIGRREAEQAGVGVCRANRGEELAVHRRRLARDGVRLVDDDEIELSKLVDLVPHRLDAAEQDLLPRVPPPQLGLIDAGRRPFPHADQLFVILIDELGRVRDVDDAQTRIFIE